MVVYAMGSETTLDLGPLRAALGDEQMVAEVLSMFLADATQLVRLIDVHLGKAEYRLVSQTAHSLKGASKNVGAWPLAHACATVERLAKEPAPIEPEIRGAVEAVCSEFARVTELLAAERSGAAS